MVRHVNICVCMSMAVALLLTPLLQKVTRYDISTGTDSFLQWVSTDQLRSESHNYYATTRYRVSETVKV